MICFVLQSFFSFMKSHVALVGAARDHFPFKSKLNVALYALAGCVIRVSIFVMYFAPSFGLFNFLRHCQSEQIQYGHLAAENFLNTTSGYLNYGGQSHLWSSIYRMNLTDSKNPLPPSLTEYTFFTKKQYFAMFWIIFTVQTSVIVVAKSLVSKPFRKLNFLEKIIHAMENSNLADPVEDWDMEKTGNCLDHYHRMKCVQKEVFFVMAINFIFNATMLTPFFTLCKF